MSVLTYFEKARQRSEAERQRLALQLSIAVVLIIAGLWLINLRFLWHNSSNSAEPVIAGQEQGVGRGVFSETIFRIKTGWQTIINQN